MLDTNKVPKNQGNAEDSDSLSPLQSPLLKRIPVDSGIRHGFFSRRGGVSTGIYESLNCGASSNDTPEKVIENRARVAAWFGQDVAHLINLHQCHSADAIEVEAAYHGERPCADGMATRTPGVILGVLTADCGPVLFADPKNGVIGAAHAGWRGAFNGILEATVDAMIRLGAERSTITASLGPTISKQAYEVGAEFVDRFTRFNPGYDRFFKPSNNEGHAMFNLPAFVSFRLKHAGIDHDIINHCTYEDAIGFFSYRRTTHNGENDYGRQISAISL